MSDLDEARRAGLIRKRLRGGHAPTRRGLRYLRDLILREEDLRSAMGEQIDQWEAGKMTKDGRREAFVNLIERGWERDRVAEGEALASLRAQGFDPLAAQEQEEE